MQTASIHASRLILPLVGREAALERLRQLHRQGKHVLILGPEGVGKSALVVLLRESLDFLLCPMSERLSEICGSLERELGLAAGEVRLVHRKNRLLKSFTGARPPVVLDGINWTTPKLTAFIEGLTERVPVWLCARSEHPWDIGHIWPLLVRFERLELKPFHPAESQMLVEAAVNSGGVPRGALKIASWLHRRAMGSPKMLHELLCELTSRHYDLTNPHSLRRLNLDRRIREVFPMATAGEKQGV